MLTNVIKRFRNWMYVVPKFTVKELNYQISILQVAYREYDNLMAINFFLLKV